MLVAAAWALSATLPARADPADTAAMQQEIQALRTTVEDLEARVQQLEARNGAGSVPAPASAEAASVPTTTAPGGAVPAPLVPAGSTYTSPEATLRSNWSQVTRGMDQAAVTQLLGAPSLQTTLDGRTVWYYSYPGTGRGSVFFTDAGTVSSRQSPFGLGW